MRPESRQLRKTRVLAADADVQFADASRGPRRRMRYTPLVRGRLLRFAALTSAVSLGCSLDWTVPASTSGRGDASLDAGQDGATPPVSSDSGTTVPTDPTQRDASTGCRSNADCAPTDLCTFAAFDCGKSGQAGTCASRQSSMDYCAPNKLPPALYCGCDGVLYDQPCTPLANGVDLGTDCPAQPGKGEATVGFVRCQGDGGVAVEDRAREHAMVDRCELDASCLGDCACLKKQFCPQGDINNGKCAGAVVFCN